MARKALGKGLKALIPDVPKARAGLLMLPVDKIVPNPAQPRLEFDEAELASLADSIKEHGLLQPLLVTESGDGSYVLLAGERRLRASKLAGLSEVPAIVRERVSDSSQLLLALVENIQRRDLTPLEQARAFQQLSSRFGLSQAEIAERVGVDRSTVANFLRLLKLEPEIQAMVQRGELGIGHAKAILSLPPELRLDAARKAASGSLSVRDLEKMGRRGEGARRRPDPNVEAAARALSLRLGVKVTIQTGKRGGKIVIHCPTDAELQRVWEILAGGEDASEEQ